MLVLERKLNSVIRIGSDIRIKVLDVPGRNRVRIGLDVPRGTLIWREEMGAPSDVRPAAPDKGLLRALIVEDDPAHAKLIRVGFERAGSTETHTVTRGEEAVELLKEGKGVDGDLPDLVVLDLMMPGMSGLEVLKEIRSEDDLEHLPIVMLSAHANDQDVSECLDAGANAFLSKTDDYNDFCDLVIRIADFWRYNRG